MERSTSGGAHILKESESASSVWGWRKKVAVFDFIMRIFGILATLAAAIAMGTADEKLPFFTQFFQFEAKYSDLPAFTYFVIANAIAAGYLILSLPISIFNMIRPHVEASKLILIIFDAVMTVVDTSGASAAAAIVDVARRGVSRANWFSFCQQFGSFCERVSDVAIASSGAAVIFVLLVAFNSSALYRRGP
eukprot:PITA_25359